MQNKRPNIRYQLLQGLSPWKSQNPSFQTEQSPQSKVSKTQLIKHKIGSPPYNYNQIYQEKTFRSQLKQDRRMRALSLMEKGMRIDKKVYKKKNESRKALQQIQITNFIVHGETQKKQGSKKENIRNSFIIKHRYNLKKKHKARQNGIKVIILR